MLLKYFSIYQFFYLPWFISMVVYSRMVMSSINSDNSKNKTWENYNQYPSAQNIQNTFFGYK